MNRLEDSIERLYDAFRSVALPDAIVGCPCCIDEKEIGVLLTTPLRQIQPEALSSYASSAFLTVGDVDDYLYFLPRILEISATEDGWWPDIEVTGRALGNTRPTSWPASRSGALNQFLHARVDALMRKEDSGSEMDAWLCGIARADLDVVPFLCQLEESPASILALYEENAGALAKSRLGNSFWERSNRGHEDILRWFSRSPAADVVLDAYGHSLHSLMEDAERSSVPL